MPTCSNRHVCVTRKAVRKNEKGGSPEPDKDAEPLGMRLGERLTSTSVKPNDDRCQDGQEAQHKAKVTEQLKLVWFHRVDAFEKARLSLDTASRLVALFTSSGFV